MPRQETTLTVFVASPSDVGAERECLENVVEEINVTRARELGIRLELVKWETHAYPGIGSDPQDVINNSVSQDYDIFIGIMWQRFGTPTLRSLSGTFEEFTIAKSRFDADPTSVRIMMYFKDAPIAPSKMDHDQLKLVSDFRKTLGPHGALYWSFEDTEQFERLARIHLQKAMQDWRDSQFATPPDQALAKIILPGPSAGEEDEDSEPGLLDLTLEFTERFAEASLYMSESYSIMELATSQISGLNAKVAGQGAAVTADDMRRVVSLTRDIATVFTEFDRNFSRAANAAADNVEAAIDAMINFVELQHILTAEEEQNAVALIQVMDNVQNSIEGYRDQIRNTGEGLDAIPRLTSDMNRAKRALRKTFAKVVERQDRAIGLVKELKKALYSLVRNGNERSADNQTELTD